jgi:hypothetical protein
MIRDLAGELGSARNKSLLVLFFRKERLLSLFPKEPNPWQ